MSLLISGLLFPRVILAGGEDGAGGGDCREWEGLLNGTFVPNEGHSSRSRGCGWDFGWDFCS